MDQLNRKAIRGKRRKSLGRFARRLFQVHGVSRIPFSGEVLHIWMLWRCLVFLSRLAPNWGNVSSCRFLPSHLHWRYHHRTHAARFAFKIDTSEIANRPISLIYRTIRVFPGAYSSCCCFRAASLFRCGSRSTHHTAYTYIARIDAVVNSPSFFHSEYPSVLARRGPFRRKVVRIQ